MDGSQKPNVLKRLIPVIIGILVFGILYVLMLNLYKSEGNAGEAKVFGSQTEDMVITAKLISIDPIKGDVTARLQFSPQGSFINAEDGTLAQSLLLDLNSASGKTEINFKKNEKMNPVDMVVSLYDGDVMSYPFDEHAADLYVGLSSVMETEGQPKEFTAVPFKVDFSGALSGYSISAEELQKKEDGYTEIYLTIARSSSVLFFAIFIMVLQWLLAIVAVSVTLTCLITGRKIEATLFSWMGALLFALVPLRNAMPSVPPVGALADYLSFFWAEILVAVSLVIFVYTYLSRPLK